MQDGAGGDIHLLLSILADGEEQARQLGEPGDDGQCYYSRTEEEEHCRGVARQLQRTFGKAIAVAKAIEAAGASGSRGTGGDRSDSPRSADESSGRTTTREPQERQDLSKRRKGLPRWTEKIRMPDSNLEVTPDDGFSWRKYGQKDILGAKFPRSYYRCTYRNAQGCPATKQVQRSDADLSVFDVTYQGAHACHQKQRHATAAPPPPPGNQPPLQTQAQDPDDMQLLMSFKDGLKVETEGLGTMTAASSLIHHDVGYGDGATGALFSFPSVALHAGVNPTDDAAAAFSPVDSGQLGGGGFSPAFASPAASGSNYFSMSHCYERGGHVMSGTDLSELGEIVSAATATTVDPAAAAAAGLDYSLYHHGELDPHLPFAPMFGASHGQYRNA